MTIYSFVSTVHREAMTLIETVYLLEARLLQPRLLLVEGGRLVLLHPPESGDEIAFAHASRAHLAEPRFTVTRLDLRRGPEDLIRVDKNPTVAQNGLDLPKEIPLLGRIEVMDGEGGDNSFVTPGQRPPRVIHDA